MGMKAVSAPGEDFFGVILDSPSGVTDIAKNKREHSTDLPSGVSVPLNPKGGKEDPHLTYSKYFMGLSSFFNLKTYLRDLRGIGGLTTWISTYMQT